MRIIKKDFSKCLDLSDEFTIFYYENYKPEDHENVTLHLAFDEETQFYDKTDEFPVDNVFRNCVLNNFIGVNESLKNTHIACGFFKSIFQIILNKLLNDDRNENKYHHFYLGKLYYEYEHMNRFVIKYFIVTSQVDWK